MSLRDKAHRPARKTVGGRFTGRSMLLALCVDTLFVPPEAGPLGGESAGVTPFEGTVLLQSDGSGHRDDGDTRSDSIGRSGGRGIDSDCMGAGVEVATEGSPDRHDTESAPDTGGHAATDGGAGAVAVGVVSGLSLLCLSSNGPSSSSSSKSSSCGGLIFQSKWLIAAYISAPPCTSMPS